MYFLKVFAVVCAIAGFVGPVAMAQSSSTLEQQITPNVCSYTTVETGLGKTHDNTCPPFAPKIVSMNANAGRPVITGVYDAVHTTMLRVRFGGVWYASGKSAELNTDGNVWVLNLVTLERPLQAGEYTIEVETTNADGELLKSSDVLAIVPTEEGEAAPPPMVSVPVIREDTAVEQGGQVTEEIPQPNQPAMEAPIAVVTTSVLGAWIVGGVVAFMAVVTLLVFGAKRRKKRYEASQ